MKKSRSLSIAAVAVASTFVIGSVVALPPVLDSIEKQSFVKDIAERAAKRDTPAPVIPTAEAIKEAKASPEKRQKKAQEVQALLKQGEKHVDEREAEAQVAAEELVQADEELAARDEEARRLADESDSASETSNQLTQDAGNVAADLYRNGGGDAAQLLVDEDAINKQARSEAYAEAAAREAQQAEHRAQALAAEAERAEQARIEAEEAAIAREEARKEAERRAAELKAAQEQWENVDRPALLAQYADLKDISVTAADEEIADLQRAEIEAMIADLAAEGERLIALQQEDAAADPASAEIAAVAVSPEPTPTEESSVSPTPKASATKTTTPTPKATATNTAAPKATATKTATPKSTSSATPTAKATKKATSKSSPTPTATKKATPTPKATPQKKAKPKPTVKPAAVTSSEWQGKAVNYAVNVANNSSAYYQLGGNGPYGYDCSGLVQQAFQHAGKSMPHRNTNSQFAGGTQVPLDTSTLKAGDLVFWGSPGNFYHVAIYMGNGKIVHARNPQSGITVTDLYYSYTSPYPVAVRY